MSSTAWLIVAKAGTISAWLAAAVVGENRRPAAVPPLFLAGYGGAWFRRWGRNLGLFALNLPLSSAMALPLTAWAAQHPLWHRPEWLGPDSLGLGGFAVPVSLPLDLLLLDLWIYWWHRANHELPLLWRFHEVHHRDRFLDATSALRFHFGEVALSAAARAVVIVLLAIPFASVLVFETLVLVAAIFHHANWRLPTGAERALARVVITPSLHWVHHHARRADTDSTYGTICSFWDRLFGSTTPTLRTPRMPIGVEGRDEAGFWQLLVLPFRRAAPAVADGRPSGPHAQAPGI